MSGGGERVIEGSNVRIVIVTIFSGPDALAKLGYMTTRGKSTVVIVTVSVVTITTVAVKLQLP